MRPNTWALILAAGDGRRLQGLAHDAHGRPAPKQYARFGARGSLIGRTLDRALGLVPHDRVVSVVALAHHAWWEKELDVLPIENVIVQPENRGTAAGVLLPLLHIAHRDPDALVVVLPSDHLVEDEATLRASIESVFDEVRDHPDEVVLLGITPDQPDCEYGWVLPEQPNDGATHRVAAFIEKPPESEAARLMTLGAVWNSFMFVARAETLIGLYRRRMPGLLDTIARGLDTLDRVYAGLETHDFSREILQSSPESLRVRTVPPCGWTDLGTPVRLERVLGPHRAAAPDRAQPAA